MISQVFTFFFVVAVSFVVLALIASFVRFHMLTHRVQQANAQDVDPEDLFQLKLVQELGALHQAPTPFSLILLEPVLPQGFEAQHGKEAVDIWVDQFAEKLRGLVRATDFVSRYEGLRFGILGRFDYSRCEVVARRLSEALTKLPMPPLSGSHQRWPVCMGFVSYPEHGERGVELLQQARAALEAARARGGNAYHIMPVPAAKDEWQKREKPAEKEESRPSGLLDELTGLLRAERLPTAMRKFVARQRKEGRAVAIVYMGIDYFHQYQSHYNKEATDNLLKGVGDVLHKRTRETDILSRVSETDFVAVMDCAPVDALVAAQRVTAEIKKIPFRFGTSNLRITMSAGIAGYPDHSGQAQEMLAFARSAMEAARERGRSVCMLYEPYMEPPKPEDRPVDVF